MSDYNLSNFEANLLKYLNELSISRKVKKRLKSDTRDYINVLKLSYPAKNFGNFRKLFSAKRLKIFKLLFNSKHKNLKRWQQLEKIITSFRDYLIRHENNYQTISEENTNYQDEVYRFIHYLEGKKFSLSTIKNYQADLNQVIKYLQENDLKLENLLDTDILLSFSDFLDKKLLLSPESVKRKLSAISSFFKWFRHKKAEIKPNIQSLHPTTKNISFIPYQVIIPNISSLIYALLLIILSVSLSIGIYQQFYRKVDTPQAFTQPSQKTIRVLSYQGRLTDKDGIPIVEPTQVKFKLWDQTTGGGQLYDSGFCRIIPDQNGIFYTMVGSTCGQSIDSNLFSHNLNTFLGITIGTDEEMNPRLPIASVGYSQNSETLQGLSPASPASISTIPYINKDGNLIIGSSSPLVKSTSGTFTLEGNNLSLETSVGSSGSISLTPDGNGSINFNLPGFFPDPSGLLNITGQNIISGNLISAVGSSLTAGYKLIDLLSGNPLSSKFSVDAGGNVYIGGNLDINRSFSSSPSGTLINSNLAVAGVIYDGGLGIFGSNGSRIPVSIDFTKDIVIEFNFKTLSKQIKILTNINEDSTKYYLFTWNTDGMMTIENCSTDCRELTKDNLAWINDSWHHGHISFSGTNIKWNIDKSGKSISASTQTDVPKLTTGFIQFAQGFSAVNNLQISPTSDLILTAGNAAIGGRLTADDHITTRGQLTTGSFSSPPTAEGNGALYYNSTDNKLYYWNSGSWVSLGSSGGVSDLSEYYGGDPTINAADIVAIKDGASLTKAYVTKTTRPYQNDVIGIVSTNPHPNILSAGVFTLSDYPVPVALSGRVPLKVSTENGPIRAGDLITSGTLEGFGMKAVSPGPIVAKALQSFPAGVTIPCPSQSNSDITQADIICGEIMVFVNIGWYDPTPASEGLTEILNLVRKDLFTAKEILSVGISEVLSSFDTLIAGSIRSDSIVSAVIEAENIKTQNLSVGIISPLVEDEEIIIEGSVSTQNLTTENLQSKNLTTDIASVSGTLYADNIQSSQIDELKSSFGKLIEKVNLQPSISPSPQLEPSPYNLEPSISPKPSLEPSPSNLEPDLASSSSSLLSDSELDSLISNTDENTASLFTLYEKMREFLTNPDYQLGSSSFPAIDAEGLIKIEQPVKITSPTTLADTSISGQLLIDGTIVMENNKIAALSDSLYLTSPKLIDFMGGKLLVDSKGNLMVAGEIIAQNGLVTSEIKASQTDLTITLTDASPSSQLAENSRIGGFGQLLINNRNESVASIDSRGNARFKGELLAKKLSLDGTIGSATIPATYQQLIIYNDSLTANSLIYLTPTSATDGSALYVANKQPCSPNDQRPTTNDQLCRPYFTIALDNNITKDITFNWWLVN